MRFGKLAASLVGLGLSMASSAKSIEECFVFAQRLLQNPRYNPRYEANDDGLWDIVTDREGKRIYKLYRDDIDAPPSQYPHQVLKTTSGKHIDLFDEILKARKAAITGEIGVLSLGEGQSDFISSLLEAKVKYLKAHGRDVTPRALGNIQAVDVSYPDHDSNGRITDKRAALNARLAHKDVYDPTMLPITQRYPQNFHSQRFQELMLKDSAGRYQKFSLIISNYSLGYVLELVPENELRPLLERVLAHLEPGGKLIMTPVHPGKNASAYDELLAKLKANGQISDYTPRDSLRQVIIK